MQGRKKASSTGGTGDKNSGKRKEIDMEFLKELLGEELYKQVESKINEHNGNEANKDKQIKLENINSGNYVSKMKYDDISNQLVGKDAELATANGLIAELKRGTKGNEELQGKITTYESDIANLQAELQETKIKSAVKVGLLSENCLDVEYVTYKLMESLKDKGETLELDGNENIKGWNDKISGLKTQLPTQFGSAGKDDYQVLGDNRLPRSEGGNDTITKEDFAKMGYKSRVELKASNPELYSNLTK